MQLYKVVDTTPYGAYNSMPANQIVAEILAVRQEGATSQLSEMLDHHYCWYSTPLKEQALEVMETLLLAYVMRLPVQITLNQQKLINYVTQDMAERFYRMAQQRLGYDGSIQVEQYSHAQNHIFRVPIATVGSKRTEWIFYPVADFREQIPLHALKAIALFRDEGLKPDAYWVADKVETVIVQAPRRIDPILCAQCGDWFAGLAMWL